MESSIPTPAQMRRLLAGIYGRGSMDIGGLEKFRSVYRPYYGPLDRLLQYVPERSRVLELGCGVGPAMFVMRGFRSIAAGYGIDLDVRSIEVASAANTEPNLRFEVRHPAELTTEEVASFNVVVCFDILHHIPMDEKAAFLMEILTKLAPGTRFILKDLDAQPARKALANRITDYLSTRSVVSYWTRRQAAEFLTENGLDIISEESIHSLIWSHYMVVADKCPR